jgi:FMN phosphatase YigB (HAD superfamily)
VGREGTSVTEGVRVAIFDLDGTLYQGDGFLPRYLEELHDVGAPAPSRLGAELDAILDGEHTLQLGNFYDPASDRIIVAPAWQVELVSTWDGEPVTDERVGDHLAYDHDLVYVGDAWQAVRALAVHHGVERSARERAFQEVRQAINSASHELIDTRDLGPVLEHIDAFEHRFLVTNTPEVLASDLITTMQLRERFHVVRCGAEKPKGLARWLEELPAQLGVQPDEILCVGDNYFNDILPALRAGCRAVWIFPFGAPPHHGDEVQVSSLAEVGHLLAS